jgi:hypothetical protein
MAGRWLVVAAAALTLVLLVALNLKDRRTHDVYRLDLKTGAVELDTDLNRWKRSKAMPA